MTLKQSENRLHNLIAAPLASMGFCEVTRLCFIRGDNERSDILNFGGRKHQGVFYFGFCVGLRFGHIAQLLRPTSTDLSMPTVTLPVHFLHEDHAYFEWSFGEEGLDQMLLDRVMAEVRTYAIPFFERFRTLASIDACLRSSADVDSFVLTAEQRLCILAAIASVRGANEEALRMLDEALAQRQDAVPAKQVLLEELRTQIVKRVSSGGCPPSEGDEAR